MVTRNPVPPGTLPNEFDANRHCTLCNRVYTNLKNYRKHLRVSHKMKLTPLVASPKPILDILPNPEDSNNYCASCDHTFGNNSVYCSHIGRVHEMIIPRLQRTKANPDVSPDINDRNNYCKSCQCQYKDRNNYRRYLSRVHKIELTPLRKEPSFDPTISFSSAGNSKICVICKIKYHSRLYYKRHMERHHKGGKNTPVHNKLTILANSNVQPDPDDLNLFCQTCSRFYSTRSKFRDHIKSIHPNIKLESFRSPANPIRLKVDAGDCNNRRCSICEVDYRYRQAYLKHMNVAHGSDIERP